MVKIKIKGNEIDVIFTTNSASRYATLFRNKIFFSLKKIGVSQDYIKLKEEVFPIRKSGAEVYWYLNGFNCYYSYNRQEKYVDNLQIISKLIDAEVNKILEGSKNFEEFLNDFIEDDYLIEKRKEARQFLGLEENENNIEIINKQYKKMAKEFHPDTENGSTEKFKKLNEAHKILRKELE
ncbi:DnaJ domain-containing protein [Candidatus Woesearchaeota archaeon]|nr:DnaJ domain-containing protein [Candidatus Woesearchaeota archaeon]